MSIRFTIILILVLMALRQTTAQQNDSNPQPEIKLQWMPLTDDKDYLEDVLEVASDYAVDGFQISHRLMHNIDEIVYPEKKRKNISADVDKELLMWLIETLNEKGYGTHYWTHEIVGPPEAAVKDGKVIIDHPQLRPFMVDKYKKAKAILPAMTSIVVTFFETEYRAYNDNQATTLEIADTPRRRVLELMDIMLEIGKELDVEIAFRGNFLQADGIFENVNGDFVYMAKNTETDWHGYSPFNDFIESKASSNQTVWVEFDAGLEYEMRNTVPYAEPEKILKRLKRSAKAGVKTFVVRLDRYGGDEEASAIYTPWGQLMLDIFTQFKKDTSVTLNPIMEAWEQKHFPDAYELVSLCTRISKHLLFPKKMWYGNHSIPPDYQYATKHLIPEDGIGPAHRNASNDNISPEKRLEYMQNAFLCYRPTPEWYASIKEDLQIVNKLMRQVEEIISANQQYIESHPVWKNSLDRLRAWIPIFQLNQEIYFGIRLLENYPNALDKEKLRDKIAEFDRKVIEIEQQFGDVPGSLIGAFIWRIQQDETVSDFYSQLDQI